MKQQDHIGFYNGVKFLITGILMLFFLNSNSQESYVKLPKTQSSCPTIIVNHNIIANESLINKYKTLIIKVKVLKDKHYHAVHRSSNLSENGIVFVELDQKIKTKSQCDLNKFFGIDKNNDVYVNGYLIEDAKYKIAVESIIDIELITPNSTNKLKHKSVNVWTITEEEREQGCKQ